jgi:uncharacterized protein with LGFP repeats
MRSLLLALGSLAIFATTDSSASISPILEKYYQNGGPEGRLGNFVTQEENTPDGVGRYVDLEYGSIYWHPSWGASVIEGEIGKKWRTLGGVSSVLGYPKSDESSDSLQWRYQLFEHGRIAWHPTFGAFEMHGEIHKHYVRLNAESGPLGHALSDEQISNDGVGRFTHFQNGGLYWHPEIGARAVYGDIYLKWKELGFEGGVLGYPLTDETAAPDKIGRFSHFQRGSIYWHPVFRAHEVLGEIRKKWEEMGWERSPLGYPLLGPVETPHGAIYSRFEFGGIFHYPRKYPGEIYVSKPETVPIYGGIFEQWQVLGGIKSAIGYPSLPQNPIPPHGEWVTQHFFFGIIKERVGWAQFEVYRFDRVPVDGPEESNPYSGPFTSEPRAPGEE